MQLERQFERFLVAWSHFGPQRTLNNSGSTSATRSDMCSTRWESCRQRCRCIACMHQPYSNRLLRGGMHVLHNTRPCDPTTRHLQAQNLPQPISSMGRFMHSDHRLYIQYRSSLDRDGMLHPIHHGTPNHGSLFSATVRLTAISKLGPRSSSSHTIIR